MINSNGTVIIDGNTFIGSGIKIINEIKEYSALLNIINNTFQGIYIRPVIEFWNVKNVSLKEIYFEYLQMIHSHLHDEDCSLGIVCNNCNFNFYDSSFKNVSLATFIHLSKCTVEIDNVRFF